MNIDNLTLPEIKNLANQLSNKGRNGDTELAHVNKFEKDLLKAVGGSGTINPGTGLDEYFSLKPPKWVRKLGSIKGIKKRAKRLTLRDFTKGLREAKFGSEGGTGLSGAAAMLALGLGGPGLAALLALYSAGSAYKGAAGQDWSLLSQAYRKKTDVGESGRPESFKDLMALFGRKGKYEGLKGANFADIIRDLRHSQGGYGTAERTDWTSELGPISTALGEFNPMKMLQERLNPYIEQQKKGVESQAFDASQRIRNLTRGRDIGGPSFGRNRDVFAAGAGVQRGLEEGLSQDIAGQRKEEEFNILKEFYGMV